MLYNFSDYAAALHMDHAEMAQVMDFIQAKPDYYNLAGIVLGLNFLTRKEMLALDAMHSIFRSGDIQLKSDPGRCVDIALRRTSIVLSLDEADEYVKLRPVLLEWAEAVLDKNYSKF